MLVLSRFKNRHLLAAELLTLMLVFILPRGLAAIIWVALLILEMALQIQKIFSIQVWLNLVWISLWSITFFYILTGEWEGRLLFFAIAFVFFILFRIYEEFRLFKLYIVGMVALEIELFLFLLLGVLYHLAILSSYFVISSEWIGVLWDIGLLWLAYLFMQTADLPYKGFLLALLTALFLGANTWVWDLGIYFVFLLSYFVKHLPHVIYGAESLLGIKWAGSPKQVYIYQILFATLLIGFLVKIFAPNF